MAGFIIGIMIGGIIGVFLMALLNASSREDDRMSDYYSKKEL